MNDPSHRPYRIAAALAWAALVGVALLTPSGSGADLPSWLEATVDKAVHMALFFVQAALFGGALGRGGSAVATRWTAAAAATGYGAILEVAQVAIDGRGLELADAAANALGAVLWLVRAALRGRKL